MRISLVAAGAALVIGLAPAEAHACAGCRNPSLAGSRGSEGPLPGGALRAGATLTGTTVHVVHEAGCADLADCDEVPVQPLHNHDQRLYPLELRLIAEYGLTETFGIELQVPFRLIRTTVEYTTPDGAPYEPLDEGIHHRNETIAGPADPWLLFRVGSTAGDWWLAARPGVSIPIGKTEEDPFELGDQGLRHQHIQLGSGTFDPLLVLEASRRADAIDLDFFAQGQVSLYENEHGYRAPWRVYGGGAVGTKLAGELRGAVGLELFHEDAERWKGEIRQDAMLGRTELLAALRFGITLGDTDLTLGLRAPLWRHIVTGDEPAGEISSPLIVNLGVSHVFGAES
jgi:hypothetical protein